MSFELNLDRVRDNVAKATTEDLLDRATVFRAGMEPAALAIIDEELKRREVTSTLIQHHWENRRSNVLSQDAVAQRCSYCERPAIVQRWGWFKLFRRLPLFPWRTRLCDEHAQSNRQVTSGRKE